MNPGDPSRAKTSFRLRPDSGFFRDNNYLPMRPEIPAKIPELKPEQGGYKAVVYSPEEIDGDLDRWSKIYENLFR